MPYWLANILEVYLTDWLLVTSSFMMSLFAFFSYKTVKNTGSIQNNLMEHQRLIQKNQYNLELLKNMLNNIEDFRKFIIYQRRELENVLYDGEREKISFNEFRNNFVKNYYIFTELGIFFGMEIKLKADKLIDTMSLAYPSFELRHCGFIKNGCLDLGESVNISERKKDILWEQHLNTIKCFIESKRIFREILDLLHEKMDYLSNEI